MADEHELTWRLSDPGMDLLERAGLAGLYMALRAAAETETSLAPLTWRADDVTADSVTVRWCGAAKPAFLRLMEWSWQVREGVLYLPALHGAKDAATLQNRVTLHNGVMRTFLQHTNVQPKGEPVTRIITLDENREIEVRYQPPIIRPPKNRKDKDNDDSEPIKLLRPWSDVEDLFTSAGEFRLRAGLSSWAFPGIGGRYGLEKKGKAWNGSPSAAILLMLTPTVCLYLRLPRTETKIKDKKVWVENWVTVVPDVRNLQEFAEKRPRIALNPDYVDVASLGDAAMYFLARYATDKPRRSLQTACRAVAMGKVSYYANQSVRKSVLDVSAEERQLKRYRVLHRELRNTYVALKSEAAANTTAVKSKRSAKKPAKPPESAPKAAGFFKLPAARGRIADNLIAGRAWYADLAMPTTWDRENLENLRKRNKEMNDRDGGNRPTSPEMILFGALCYQRSNLMKLIVEDEMWDNPHDQCFLEAFWETLARLYFLERKAVEERGGSRTPEDRMNDLNEKTRRDLMQAKTRILLRKTLAEFFAKPAKLARSETLCAKVAMVWRTIDSDWRKGRDLALLALITYQSREKRETAIVNESQQSNQGV
jgi:CRISPR-associated protein Cas8a1/Csx13